MGLHITWRISSSVCHLALDLDDGNWTGSRFPVYEEAMRGGCSDFLASLRFEGILEVVGSDSNRGHHDFQSC